MVLGRSKIFLKCEEIIIRVRTHSKALRGLLVLLLHLNLEKIWSFSSL